MENKETLSYLNSKAWYRALKVAYIFFAIICYSMAITSIFTYSFSLYKNYQYYLEVRNIDKKQTEEIKRIIEYGKSIGKSKIDIVSGVSEYRQLNPYINVPQKPNILLWVLSIIILIPLSLLCSWLATKISRWIFYYIVLGTIKPEK